METFEFIKDILLFCTFIFSLVTLLLFLMLNYKYNKAVSRIEQVGSKNESLQLALLDLNRTVSFAMERLSLIESRKKPDQL